MRRTRCARCNRCACSSASWFGSRRQTASSSELLRPRLTKRRIVLTDCGRSRQLVGWLVGRSFSWLVGRSVIFSFARVEDVSCGEARRGLARRARGEGRGWVIDQRCFRWDRVQVCYTGSRGKGYKGSDNSRCTHSLFV